MTTKHTCNEGRGPFFGKLSDDCVRCSSLKAGAPRRTLAWVERLNTRKAQERSLQQAIRSHDFVACARKNVVCTHFEW